MDREDKEINRIKQAANAAENYKSQQVEKAELQKEKGLYQKQVNQASQRIEAMPDEKLQTVEGQKELQELAKGRDMLQGEVDNRQAQIDSIESKQANSIEVGEKQREQVNESYSSTTTPRNGISNSSQPKLNDNLVNRETQDWNQASEPNSLNEASKDQAGRVSNPIQKFNQQGQETRQANEAQVDKPKSLDTEKETQPHGRNSLINSAKEEREQPAKETSNKEKGNDLDQDR